jgi:hypothetical protein
LHTRGRKTRRYPVLQASTLVINFKTAEAPGLQVPSNLVAVTDEVIE